MKTQTNVPQGVYDALDRMRQAWDAGDAGAYADEFTADATYVIFAGIVSDGRDEIHRDHVPVFERWQRGSRMAMRVLDARPLGADVAVVLTEGGLYKGEPKRVRYDKVQTFVMVREGDTWRCTAFQNTKRNRIMAAVNAREKRRLAA
nr:SgcJ/EcaC family oxidoreductase [Microbacterium bovistercoris]